MPKLLPLLIQTIQLVGALVVVWHGLASLAGLALRRTSLRHARLTMVQGVLYALGYTMAATLLRAVELESWSDIGAFAAIFAIRTGIKQALLREEAWLERAPGAATVRLSAGAGRS